jgi:hypothetical protein
MLPRLNLEFPHLQDLLRAEDQSKFEKIYDHFAPALYGWILNNVSDIKSAEEILYRSFQKVIQIIDQYKPEKCGFLIWLIQICNKEIELFNNNPMKFLKLESSKTINTPKHQSASISIQTGA